MRQGQFVENFGIGPHQINSHCTCGLIANYTALKCTSFGVFQAFICSDDDGIKTTCCRARDFENALQRCNHIFHTQFLAIRKLDAFTNFEDIGFPIVGGHRKGFGYIGHLHKTFCTCSFLETNQTIMKRLEHLPILQCIIDVRIHSASRRTCNNTHRAAAMFGLVFSCCWAQESRHQKCRCDTCHQ